MFSSKFLEYEIGIQTANKYSFLKRFLLQQNHPSAIECCGLSSLSIQFGDLGTFCKFAFIFIWKN